MVAEGGVSVPMVVVREHAVKSGDACTPGTVDGAVDRAASQRPDEAFGLVVRLASLAPGA